MKRISRYRLLTRRSSIRKSAQPEIGGLPLIARGIPINQILPEQLVALRRLRPQGDQYPSDRWRSRTCRG